MYRGHSTEAGRGWRAEGVKRKESKKGEEGRRVEGINSVIRASLRCTRAFAFLLLRGGHHFQDCGSVVNGRPPSDACGLFAVKKRDPSPVCVPHFWRVAGYSPSPAFFTSPQRLASRWLAFNGPDFQPWLRWTFGANEVTSFSVCLARDGDLLLLVEHVVYSSREFGDLLIVGTLWGFVHLIKLIQGLTDRSWNYLVVEIRETV